MTRVSTSADGFVAAFAIGLSIVMSCRPSTFWSRYGGCVEIGRFRLCGRNTAESFGVRMPFGRILCTRKPGAWLATATIVIAPLVPLLLRSLRVEGQRLGMYAPEIGVWLYTGTNM